MELDLDMELKDAGFTETELQNLHRRKKKVGMVKSRSVGSWICDICIWIILILVMLSCFIPLWHVLMSSISDGQVLLAKEGFVGGICLYPVGGVTFEGYSKLFADASLVRGFFNTIFYVVASTALGMVINIAGAYVLSRNSKLRPVLTIFVLITIMFNGGLVPTYAVVNGLGFVDSPLAIIIPGCTNAFFVIMLANAFKGVPESTVEAAKIDGAGHFRIMFQVLLPQSMTFVAVILLNSIVLQWNSWFPAMLYLGNRAKDWWPLQTWMRYFIANSRSFLMDRNPDYSEYLIQYAAIVVSTLPILVAFPFFQKILEKGVLVGGVKE